MRNEKRITADLTFYIASNEEYKREVSAVFEGSDSKGVMFADHELLLDPESNFFADGKFILKCVIKLTDEKKEMFLNKKYKKCSVPPKNFLSVNLMEDDEKDCIITVDNQIIMVHKLVLGLFSPIFKAMIATTQNDDDDEKKGIEVSDFEYKIVKYAVDFCYGSLSLKDLEIDDLILLFKFADKYKINDLKKEVQYEILPKMTPENVCTVLTSIVECDAEWLKKICFDRMELYFDTSKEIHESDTLNDEIKAKFFDKLMLPLCTMKVNKSDGIDADQNITEEEF
uniref:BTB domain-containing protein n=1 Tax=Panagrolaimus sp. ES5 TaxID=591445 RepID=A0AC34G715_9BILA